MTTPGQPSAALLAANERLRRLQAQVRSQTIPRERPLPAVATADLVAALPAHLGWGSAALTKVLRQAAYRHQAASTPANSDWLAEMPVKPPTNAGHDGDRLPAGEVFPDQVRLYPDIALGMLNQKVAAVGRLWLLMRLIDRSGSGVLPEPAVQAQLAHKRSRLRVVGKRQLRKLLNRGEGVFWKRQNGHIWLRSTTRVAAALGVARLSGRPVALPLSVLLDGVGAVRAHFYASYHSGRVHRDEGKSGNPISRDTLAATTGVSRRTQIEYERRLNLRKQENYAVGPRIKDQASSETWYWRHKTAVFKLRDSRGLHGQPGEVYLARQLPNSYAGCHRQMPRGKQKQINRELADLVIHEAPGNGRLPVKCFFSNGRQAVINWNPEEVHTRYWRSPVGRRPGMILWQVITQKD